ncbi:hypothetical protein Tco_1035784 [Tanacetum coccineum]
MYKSKSFESHDTHHKLYDLLYESLCLDQESIDVQDLDPSFKKRPHDHQDPLNDREGEKRKKRKKDAGEPSSRSSKTSNMDQVENHILRLSTFAVAKKIKELIKKDELTIADLEGFRLEMLKRQYKNDVELEYHVEQLKATVLEEAQWSNGECDVYHTKGIYDMIPNRWSKKTHLYQIDAVNDIHHWEDARKDFFKAEMGNRSSEKVYSDKRIISFVKVDVKMKWGYGFLTSIVVWRSDKKKYEFNYADLPRLSLNDVEDMYLLKIPYTTLGTEKGDVYVNQHNMKSLMKLNEVNKFYDGTLLKVRDNLLKMVKENILGRGNKRLDDRDWSKNDIKRSNEKLEKIDKTLKRREQLRRLEEYVGERPRTFDPRTFVTQ